MISVVLPVMDGAMELPDALASAPAAGADEVVVVDHGSKDGTRQVASSFEFVRLVDNPDPELSSSYNAGIAAARGDLIAFMGHDDLYQPGALRALEPALEEAMVAFGRARFELLGPDEPPGFRPELLDGPRDVPLPETMLARREAFDRVGPMRPGDCFDLDWIARLYESGIPVARLPSLVVCKRIRPDSEAHRAAAADPTRLVQVLHDSIQRRQQARV